VSEQLVMVKIVGNVVCPQEATPILAQGQVDTIQPRRSARHDVPEEDLCVTVSHI
jgi:hypothetical protein